MFLLRSNSSVDIGVRFRRALGGRRVWGMVGFAFDYTGNRNERPAGNTEI